MDLKNLEDYLDEIELELIENQFEVKITDRDFENSDTKILNNEEESNNNQSNERIIR